ncbi:MAG: class I SAM-dependent methyltransferase [Alphaproteobacteria bacterium]
MGTAPMTADAELAIAPLEWIAIPTDGIAPGQPRGVRLLLALAGRIRVGRIAIVAPDGRRYLAVGAAPGRSAELVVRRARLARRLLTGGSTGFAEAYVDGDWDSPDPAALMSLGLENEAALGTTLGGGFWRRVVGRIGHLLRDNSRMGARRNIRHHYDLGNAFYERWLDRTMTYSGAVFAAPNQDLAAAQVEKYQRLATLMALRPGMTVLEIGCGWGGFARHLARTHACRVTAITVSPAQHAHARAAIRADGLDDRVDVRLIDYRDVGGTYDRIASIEMIEAVGERYWPLFFARLAELLAPGGIAALQAICIAPAHFASYRRTADFIQRQVFPGGMLPTLAAIRDHAGRAGLSVSSAHAYGPDYARTLACWKERFGAEWPSIAAMGFDERFRRRWEMYLDYCRAGFEVGTIDVHQIGLTRT